MKSQRHNSQLIAKATSSKNLIGRAAGNRLYAKKDFSLWVSTLLDKISFSSVFDVCCGTGNQLILYAARPDVTSIVGVDISKEALGVAKERLEKTGTTARITLKEIKMEEMFSDSQLKNMCFDLVSCFYGLYYSQDAAKTLQEMIEHLKDTGTILIVGPYGKNNATLFSLLERHFRLPELAKRSSSTFMEKEVFPILSQNYSVESEGFVNEICYPSAKTLIDYWRSSTFYAPEHEGAVMRDIEARFSGHGEFIVEKHIMAYIARRKR